MSGADDTRPTPVWSEKDSAEFIELGRIYTPSRDELCAVMLDLIPAAPAEAFQAVELGVGVGWLSAAILERYPAAHVLGLDGSPMMLAEATRRTAAYPGRFETRPFRLEDSAWLADVAGDVRCFVSSLVIHHLDGVGKRALYQALHTRLAPGGALLIADLVAPRSEWERRMLAHQWDAETRRQSLELSGSLDAYQRFLDDHWNIYNYPDPMDMPSTTPDHLAWLAEAGFTNANVFWQRAGVAVYGGYKAG